MRDFLSNPWAVFVAVVFVGYVGVACVYAYRVAKRALGI